MVIFFLLKGLNDPNNIKHYLFIIKNIKMDD